MDTLFSSWEETLNNVLRDLPEGPTRFACEAQLRHMRKRVMKRGGSLRTVALKEFSIYNESSVHINLAHPILVGARGLLSQWLDVDLLGGHDHVEAIIADNLHPGPGSAVYDGRSTSGFAKRNMPIAFASKGAALEYAALAARHRPDLVSVLRRVGVTLRQGRLTTVPKNTKTDRVIAIEPTGMVELQNGFAAVLVKALRRLGINLENQQGHNRRMCREGSLFDSLATLDLSRASDSLSRDLLTFLLPSWVVKHVFLYTSPLHPKGRVVLTMGNGITFPLQTLVWLAMACSATKSCGLHYRINKNVAVFGDDIIVPSLVYRSLCHALSSAGASVNLDKSFASGPFRESCGVDSYLGYNVRPFSPRVELESTCVKDWAYVINGILAWHYRIGLPCPLTNQLLRIAKKKKIPFVPMHAPIDSGIRVTRNHDHAAYVRGGWSYLTLHTQPLNERKVWPCHPYAIQATLAGFVRGRKGNLYLNERTPTRTVTRKAWSCLPWQAILPEDRSLYDWLT